VDERAEIQAAMGRLLDGTPLRPDGKLTIVSLAAEAGVKRYVLTHKHTDLKDLFYARIKAQQSVPASEIALREQNDQLRRKLDDVRAERDEYRQAAVKPGCACLAPRRLRNTAEPSGELTAGDVELGAGDPLQGP
jgi:hypothetical protein